MADSENENYLNNLSDSKLSDKPDGSPYTRIRLILGQHRHLDMHIGMFMEYIIAETGLWPRIITPHELFPSGDYGKYFNYFLNVKIVLYKIKEIYYLRLLL